eukprot:3424797-Ditylum_brightwellii.AAC.1
MGNTRPKVTIFEAVQSKEEVDDFLCGYHDAKSGEEEKTKDGMSRLVKVIQFLTENQDSLIRGQASKYSNSAVYLPHLSAQPNSTRPM